MKDVGLRRNGAYGIIEKSLKDGKIDTN